MSKQLKNITFGTEMKDSAEIEALIAQTVSEFNAKIDLLKSLIDGKQGKLTAGDNISISSTNVISSTASSGSSGGSSGGGSGVTDSQLAEAIEEAVENKQDKLTAGSGISLAEDGTIAANLMLDLTEYEGYLNSADSNFYEDIGMTDLITPVPGAMYVDLSTGRTWLYKSATDGYVETPFVTMKYVESALNSITAALNGLSSSAETILA